MKRVMMSILTFFLLAVASVQAATVQLPRTGQTVCYDAAGTVIDCAGTGQDGALQKGTAWPDPRFTDNSNGTVTDNLTGLIWLKNANCTDTVGGIAKAYGYLVWADALTWSNSLASGACGLTDGSSAGQWRLPNRKELQSLIDRSRTGPALPGGHPFSNVQSNFYWSSSTYAGGTGYAWYVGMDGGFVSYGDEGNGNYVWPVRSGQ